MEARGDSVMTVITARQDWQFLKDMLSPNM